MNWFKKAQIDITFKEEVTDFYDNQLNVTLQALDQSNNIVGYIQYTKYNDEIYVNLIQVLPEFRNQKIGTRLIKKLQEMFPDKELHSGYMTDLGKKLYDSLPKKEIKNKRYEFLNKKKIMLSEQLYEVESKLNQFYSSAKIEDKDLPEFHRLGEQWNKIYDSINAIDKRLQTLEPSKTIIE